MAELAVFNIASKVLSTLASPAIKLAYDKGLLIWKRKDELEKLRITITTIQAVLLDAEKKQQNNSVKEWIKRLKGVLYDADDLFDEVVTDDLLKQQFTFFKKVRVSRSKLNPIVYRLSIAKKVKAIRNTLLDISNDMVGLGFVSCDKFDEQIPTGLRRGQDPGSFVDSENVIGRDEDKKVILEMLINESDNPESGNPLVIAIVGIGGMGKTTLAQLVYNDDKVEKNFEKRWFACISDTSDDKEVIGKIFQSVCDENYSTLTLSQLQDKIRESVARKKFLLVLDDVWEDDRGKWINRMSLLSDGAKGSKIIVTTRSTSVAAAVGGLKTHNLGGLSEDKSWELFRRIAFPPENENDPRRIDLGKEILKKCKNVPLAVRSIASLLFEKNTIEEWESVKDEELQKLGQIHEDGIIPVLKISYDHLRADLKQCFGYCSLFPKDHIIVKQDLIYHWIAQGYIRSNKEETGHSYFMYLLRRGFFQEIVEDKDGEIESCKMHDLIHDLAQHVAGEESITLTTSSVKSNFTRHVSICHSINDPQEIQEALLNSNRLRSFLFVKCISDSRVFLDQLLANSKLLRSLSISRMEIESVPSSIGELKHLRYLDLSNNTFACLPDSMTNLLNLLALDLHECLELEVLPDKFRKLTSLRYLNIDGCTRLKDMPPGIGEMTCLHFLSYFKVGEASKVGVKALTRLELRGKLSINFDENVKE